MKRYNPTVEQTPMGTFAAMVEKPEGDYVHIDTLNAVIEMVRDKEERYGAGNMLSMWTGNDIADDILERIGAQEVAQ